MDKKELNVYDYTDKALDSIINRLSALDLDSSYYLIVLAGPNKAAKKSFLSRIEKETGAMKEISLRDVVSQNVNETYQKIDEMFSHIGETEKNIILRHGDVLSGEYTGFTYSSVRYATPQEKYLLKKINNSGKFIIIDLHDSSNINNTLARYAQTAVRFDEADTFFGKLKQISVHGHTFASKRPVASGV